MEIPKEHWAVTVSRSGDEVVTIESNFLSGREISATDAQTIRTAAQHLLSFVGDQYQSKTITLLELDGAVAASAEHIAPCGHNELGDLYDAVCAAFHQIGLSIEKDN